MKLPETHSSIRAYKEKKVNNPGRKMRLKFERGKQRELLLECSRKQKPPQRAFAKLLGTNDRTLRGWLKERNNITSEVFQKLCSIQPELKQFENHIEEKLPMNWGAVKGGLARISQIEDINEYTRFIRNRFIEKNKERRLQNKPNLKNNNELLCQLKRDNVDLACILAVSLLTDGTLSANKNRHRLSYATKDVVLKDFMESLLLELSPYTPTVYKHQGGVFQISLTDDSLCKKLFGLSPNYKTTPAPKQAVDEFLKEPQPTISFLGHQNKETISWCIRFAFTTDGCVSLAKNKNIELNFACYNDVLSREWQPIFKKYGLNGKIAKHKNSWCNTCGIRIYDLESIKNFFQLGGFIDGVKISRKSKRFYGLEKNELLKRIMNGKRGI